MKKIYAESRDDQWRRSSGHEWVTLAEENDRPGERIVAGCGRVSKGGGEAFLRARSAVREAAEAVDIDQKRTRPHCRNDHMVCCSIL